MLGGVRRRAAPGQDGVQHIPAQVGPDCAAAQETVHPLNLVVEIRLGCATAQPASHVTRGNAVIVHRVTPARSRQAASRRRPRWAATRTAPGVLFTMRATSTVSSPATTRSTMISA